jgi:hypothetical protein
LHKAVYKKLDVRKLLTDHRKNKNFYHHSRSATIPAGGGTREAGNSSLREEERDAFISFKVFLAVWSSKHHKYSGAQNSMKLHSWVTDANQ